MKHLRGQLELAEVAHSTQRNATQNAVRLTELLHKLADDTRDEMREISNASLALREEMLSIGRDGFESPIWPWGKLALLRLVEVVLRGMFLMVRCLRTRSCTLLAKPVDPLHLEALMQLPILRAAQWSFQVFYLTLRTCSSSVTVCFPRLF